MGFYLAFKEVWRGKGRFMLLSMVIALITTLVLFIAGLAEGLAQSNKQYLENLDADLLVFQSNTDLSTTGSRVAWSKLNDIRRVEGVKAAGPIGFSNATLVFSDGREPLDISLIGVEAGQPGAPIALEGSPLLTNRGNDAVIDRNVAKRAGVKVGDRIYIKSTQGTKEEFYDVKVIGLSQESLYFFQPSVFLPFSTWDQVRPQGVPDRQAELTANVVAVQTTSPDILDTVAARLTYQVSDIEVSDIPTAIMALPGYSAQQSTLNTQSIFTLLIGVLVIGGFFQIQMLQKVPLIGVLKAVGTANRTVALSVVLQIIMVTTFGVFLGGLATFGLALGIPDTVPVLFSGSSVVIAIVSLLLIGPIGGLVSVRKAVKVEPLLALGLSQ